MRSPVAPTPAMITWPFAGGRGRGASRLKRAVSSRSVSNAYTTAVSKVPMMVKSTSAHCTPRGSLSNATTTSARCPPVSSMSASRKASETGRCGALTLKDSTLRSTSSAITPSPRSETLAARLQPSCRCRSKSRHITRAVSSQLTLVLGPGSSDAGRVRVRINSRSPTAMRCSGCQP